MIKLVTCVISLMLMSLLCRAKTDDANLEQRIAQLEATVAKLFSERHDQELRRQKRASVDPIVSFSAVLDHAQYHVTIDQLIVFNRVYINDGNGYDNLTGVFNVPSNGVYLFSYFIATFGMDEIVVRLVVDGENKVDAIAETLRDGHNDQGGNVVILKLSLGQRVYIQAYDQNDVHIDGGNAYRSPAFQELCYMDCNYHNNRIYELY